MKFIISILFALLFSLFSTSNAFGQNFYVYKNRRGVMTISSTKPVGRKYKNFQSNKKVHYSRLIKSYPRVRARKSKYDSLISELSRKYNIDAALVKAVMHAESAFKVSAKSHKGATGLMQLMPATARRFGVKNIWSPNDNILGGVKYLSWLNKEFNGNMSLIAAGYNAGEGAVKKYNGIPPYKETRGYVSKVMHLRRLYVNSI